MKKFINAIALLAVMSSTVVFAQQACRWGGIEDGRTRAIKTTEYGDERHVVWSGPEYYCNASSCTYTYARSISISYSYTANPNFLFGKSLQAILGFSYTYTKTVSDSFNFAIGLAKGQYAKPAVIEVKRYKSGYYLGVWVQTSKACQAGMKISNWDANRNGGNWSGRFHTRGPYVTYIINGRVPGV